MKIVIELQMGISDPAAVELKKCVDRDTIVYSRSWMRMNTTNQQEKGNERMRSNLIEAKDHPREEEQPLKRIR